MEKTIPPDMLIFLNYLQAQEELAKAARLQIMALYNPETPKQQTPTTQIAPKPITQPKPTTAQFTAKELSDIQNSFHPDNVDMLSFNQQNGYWIIKPKQYLGSDRFAEIADEVKAIGGEYISAGRDSHFRVPTRK